jgi:aromatic ring-opening dioxygenase catalytic subunit (LigB family)
MPALFLGHGSPMNAIEEMGSLTMTCIKIDIVL